MTSVFGDVFTEMVVAVVIAAVGMRLRQSLIVAFIVAGVFR